MSDLVFCLKTKREVMNYLLSFLATASARPIIKNKGLCYSTVGNSIYFLLLVSLNCTASFYTALLSRFCQEPSWPSVSNLLHAPETL